MKIFILFIMLFFHIVDDYYLQGWLAQAKQQRYWLKYCGLDDDDIRYYEENKGDGLPFDWRLKPNVRQKDFELYKNDYKMALVEHAFSWSFMVHLPIMAYLVWSGNTSQTYIIGFCVSFVINWVIHAIVDDFKANKMRINLIQDQMIHFMQIICTWGAWMI